MADKKISQLTAATTPLAGTEVLPIVQSGTTVKVANNDLRPKQIQSNATSGVLQVTGPAAASTRVMTTPDANFTVARTDAAQTFTGTQTFSSDLSVNSIRVGIGAGANTNNTAMGASALQNNSTGDSNTAYGWRALLNNQTGNNNTAIGNGAGYSITGSGNTLIGQQAGQGISTGQNNTVIGRYYGALAPISGTGSNYVVLADGAGNIPAYGDSSLNWNVPSGNLVIGTSGKGIDFSATPQPAGMTSELLSDYEEGTGTITLTPETSGSITINPSYDTYAYTKIGRQVTVTGYFLIDGVSSPVGTYVDLALPYAVADLTESAGRTTGLAQFYTGGTSSFRQVNLLEGTSAIRIYVTAASIAAADDCTFSVTYFTS